MEGLNIVSCRDPNSSPVEFEQRKKISTCYFAICLGIKEMFNDIFFVDIGRRIHNVGVLTRGSGSQLVNAACFLAPDVDARGNTVTHGFILVPAAGPYVQQEGVRGHCIILHPEFL